ncbi:MAG: hypothetical protein GY855_04450, partial [candidate division Zixibacteria bacterium]|nr:hypothetical protein [candidate division Zixibacteria bacterium]
MRYLPKLFLLILIGALAVTLNMGCSNNNSTNVGVTAGDTTSTSYQSAKEAFGVMYDSLTTNFNRGMEYQDGFNPPPRAASTTDTVYTGYDSTTGWWYYYEDGQDDYGEYVIADSVRYWAESTYQRNPDEFTDRMELKFNAEVVYDGLLY